MDSIGARIKWLRQEQGVTQQALAAGTGLQRGNISHYERDKVKPSAAAIVQLAAFFGVSSDWLLTGQEGGAGQPLTLDRGRLADAARSGEGQSDGDRLSDEQLIADFLAYWRSRQPTTQTAGAMPQPDLVREEAAAYLPVFAPVVAVAPILPGFSWAGFAAVAEAAGGAQAFLLQVVPELCSDGSLSVGDLAVIGYQEQPAADELALIERAGQLCLVRWAQPITGLDGAPQPAQLVGRVRQVVRRGQAGSVGPGTASPLFLD